MKNQMADELKEINEKLYKIKTHKQKRILWFRNTSAQRLRRLIKRQCTSKGQEKKSAADGKKTNNANNAKSDGNKNDAKMC